MAIINNIIRDKSSNDFTKQIIVEFVLSFIIKRLTKNATVVMTNIRRNVGTKANTNLPKTTSNGDAFHPVSPPSGEPK